MGTIREGDGMAESLEAQLQASLNMIPAYTWYAARSGGVPFVDERAAEEASRIYGYPPKTEPTPDLILQRTHPDSAQ